MLKKIKGIQSKAEYIQLGVWSLLVEAGRPTFQFFSGWWVNCMWFCFIHFESHV